MTPQPTEDDPALSEHRPALDVLTVGESLGLFVTRGIGPLSLALMTRSGWVAGPNNGVGRQTP